MIVDFIPLFMFVALFILLILGVPISFSLGFVGVSFSAILWGLDSTSLLVDAAWSTMNDFNLIAIPLFIFMAITLEKGDIINDLFDSVYKWSGGLRGGLALASIIVGAILAAVSGVVAAGIIGLGLIALPSMLKYGYQRKISLGVIMASGTLGQIIPPSINMIIYGAMTGVSVGSLFAGGITAGVVLGITFAIYILIRAALNKDLLPAPSKENRFSWKEKMISLKEIILPGILIIAVLGSIFSGIATPTEGAGVGAMGALLITILTGRLKLQKLKEAVEETIKISAMVGWILVGASGFSAVFSGVGGNRLVSQIAEALPGGPYGILVLSIVFIIFLGMFLETTAVIMLAAPIITPVVVQAGFDPLWWGIIFMILLQMAFLTPPFGFAIFYLKSVAPKDISIREIYSATIPFLILQLLVIVLLTVFPSMLTWLPELLK